MDASALAAASLFGSFEIQQTQVHPNPAIGLTWQQQLDLCDSQNSMDDQEEMTVTSLGIGKFLIKTC